MKKLSQATCSGRQNIRPLSGGHQILQKLDW